MLALVCACSLFCVCLSSCVVLSIMRSSSSSASAVQALNIRAAALCQAHTQPNPLSRPASAVLPFLQSHDSYGVDACLRACLKHSVQVWVWVQRPASLAAHAHLGLLPTRSALRSIQLC